MSATRKRKTYEHKEIAEEPIEISTPRRFFTGVSNLFKRSPLSLLKSTQTPSNTPAIDRSIEKSTEESNDIKTQLFEDKVKNSDDIYYKMGRSVSKDEPRTKHFQPSPPAPAPARQEKEKRRKTNEEKEDANNPVTDVLVYNPTEKSKTTSTTFSSFPTTLPFSTGTSNLPIFRRKPLRLVDPSHTFRLLEQLEEELPCRKSTAPIAVKKLQIQTLSDSNWVRRPKTKNAPMEIKKDTEVRPEFSLDFIVSTAVKPFDFMKAEGVIIPNNLKLKSSQKKNSLTETEDSGGAAYKEQTVKQPDSGGWGANMFLAKDQWKCEGCFAYNKDTDKKCSSCGMPRGKSSYDGVTLDDDDDEEVGDKKEIAGSIGASGFSFGKPAASIGASGFSFGKNDSTVTTGVTFGAPKEEKKEKEPPKFSFGAAPKETSKEQPKSLFSTSTPAKPAPSGGFLFGAKKEEPFHFGAQPPIKESITILKSPTTDTTTTSNNGRPVFKFGKTPDSKPSAKDATPGFALDKGVTFSATPAPKRKKDAGSTPFAPKGTPEPFKKVDTPMPKGGVEKKESIPKTAGFSFDNANAVKKVKPEVTEPTSVPTTTAPTKLQFTFGQTTEEPEKKLTSIAESKPEVAKPSFTFGQPSKTDTPPAAFGTSSEPPKATPAFSFGQTPAQTPASSSFGSAPASTPAFGQTPTEKTPVTTSFTAPNATSFGPTPTETPATSSFGSTSAPSSKRKSEDSSFAPAAPASTTPAFTFGAKPKTDAPAQPFSTNATFPPAAAQSFGSSNASSGTSFTQPFGGTNTTASTGFNTNFSASAPAPTPFGGSTSFGTSNPPASASFGASNPPASGATSFGSNTQPFGNTASAQPAGFTPAPSTSFQPAFGASGATGNFAAPAPSNFNAAPATGFNASFNQQAPQAQNFGANPSGGFNATASFGATPGFNAGGGGGPSFSLGAGGTKSTNTRGRRVIRARRPPGTK